MSNTSPLSSAISNISPLSSAVAAQFAAITYCPDPADSVQTNFPGWNIVWNGIVTEDGNYAFIATDPSNQYYVLAIRGSLPILDVFKTWDDFANWVLEDLDVITQVEWPYSNTTGAYISSGANRAFNNLIGMTDQMGSGLNIANYLILNACNANAQIIITGHSLGGNMANVFASFFNWVLTDIGYGNSNVNNYLYTFAAPPAGNGIFAPDLDAKYPGSQSFHYDIDNDIVPKIPVCLAMTLLAALYIPSPAADQIDITYDGFTITFADAIIGLAVALAPYGYQQPSNNYQVLNYALSGQFPANTFEDWFDEAGYQHTVGHYVSAVGGLPITCTSSAHTA